VAGGGIHINAWAWKYRLALNYYAFEIIVTSFPLISWPDFIDSNVTLEKKINFQKLPTDVRAVK